MWLLAGKDFKGLKPMDFLKSWEGCMSAVIRHPKEIVTWTAPHDIMKFNVDGSARGKPGPLGLGVVLRDHSGEISLVFTEREHGLGIQMRQNYLAL